ncbi:MAG: tyrosine-type recombinase/integrase, partial [Agathobacter sp.]
MDEKIELFLNYMENVKRSSKNTLDSYRRDLRGMKEYFTTIGVTEVGKINCTNINSYVLYLEKTGKSPATISRNISSIKTFFRCMINNGYIKREPTENVNVPEQIVKTNTSENKISEEDKRRFIDCIECSDVKGLRDRAMFELLFDTGMKVSEITGIKLWDINLQYSYVTCHGSKRDKTVAFGNRSCEAVYQYI